MTESSGAAPSSKSTMPAPLTRHDLVAQLARARAATNLSIRRAASLAKVPPSTAQGWFEGKHLPTPALMPNFLTLLEALDLADDEESRRQWRDAILLLRSGRTVADSPYVGLRSYAADEAEVYVGRERSYEALTAACLADRFTVVVGDSGSGKSSLLAAGVIGRACAAGGPLGHLTPLSLSVAELLDHAPPQIPTLLVIDQFEESERLPAEDRARIFEILATLPENVTCVVALAASSFGFALRDERFAAHLDSPVLLGPLTTNEYTQIIEVPANRHGRNVAPELIQVILGELHRYGDPSPGTVLPLLSSAMRRCWRHARGQTLEVADYQATGGLWSALHDEAEMVFLGLSAPQQAGAKRLLLSMVQHDGDQPHRRKVWLEGLAPEMTPIIDAFLAARLFSRADEWVTISHDALLVHWERLKEWIQDERASLAIARRIHLAAQLWDEGGRADESLLPIEAEAWSAWAASDDAPLLSANEHEFIEASREFAATRRLEQSAIIKRLRRRQGVAIAAAVLAGAMVVATTAATFQANRYRLNAEETTVSAESREIALIADELRSLAPNTAAQLSVAALAMSDSVQTRSAVLTSAGNPMPTRASGPAGNTMIAHAPARDLIVRGDNSGTISVWAGSELREEPERVESGGGQLFTLSVWDTADRTLALVGGQQTAGVWDLTGTPRKLGEFGADTVSYSSAWHEGIVYVGTLTGEIRRIDLTDPDAPRELPPIPLGGEVAVSALAASPAGIFAGGLRGEVTIFDLTGDPAGSLPIDGTALSISFSPDATEVLIGSASGDASLWGLAGAEPELLERFDLPSPVHAVRHDGERLLIAGAFGSIREYNEDRDLIATYPERTTVVSVDSVDGGILAGTTGGSTTLWNSAHETTVYVAPEGVALYDLVNGGDVIVVGTSAGAQVMAPGAEGWRALSVEEPPGEANYTYYYEISADGQVLVNQTSNGDLLTLDRRGEAFEISDVMPGQSTIAGVRLSPSGRYLALGYRGVADFQIYERTGATWTHLTAVTAWPGTRAFSPDERFFAAMNYDGDGVVLWEMAPPGPRQVAEITLPEGSAPLGISFGQNHELAIGDNRGEISIYSLADPEAPEHVRQLRDARSSLTQVAFSPDGEHLLAATGEGQLWVWKVANDMELELQLTPGSGAVSGAMWFEGQVVMSADNRAVAWPGDPVAAASELCARFGDKLTPDEWARLVPDVEQVDGCAASTP